MNSTNPSRFSCRMVRLWSVVTHDGNPSREHLATCAACQQYFNAAAALESQLRRSAPQSFAFVPSGLENEIMRAVRNAQPSSRPERRPLLGYAILGGVAAIAAVVVVQLRPAPHVNPGTSVAAATDYRAEAAQLADAVRSLPAELDQLKEPAAALTQNNGLQREVQNVYSDAQSALAFLKLNFLPGTAEPQPSST